MKNYITILCCVFWLTIVVSQPAPPILETDVSGVGKSMDRETALRLACQNSLYTLLTRLLPQQMCKQMNSDIQRYLAGNYKKYFLAPPVVESWDGWELKISGKIDQEKLLIDIHEHLVIPDIQDRIAILEWPDELTKISVPYGNELKHIVQVQLETVLKKYGLSFTTAEQIQHELEQEIRETGLSSNTEDVAYLQQNRSHFIIKLGLVITSPERKLSDKMLRYWQIRLVVEIYTTREKTKIFSGVFPPEDATYGTRLIQDESDSRILCEQTVAKVSRISAQNIADYLKEYRPMPKNIHTVYFTGFSRSEKLKILRAFDHMVAKKQVDDIQRSTGGGDTLKILITTQHKSNMLQEMISTYCIEEDVQVLLDPSRQDDISQNYYYVPDEHE